MGARLYPALDRRPEIVELRRLSARDLAPLLQEEVALWRERLDWDFSKSAGLVRRFVDLRALSGAALLEGGELVGYVYYVIEDSKGLIGDLYLRHTWRTEQRENALLAWALDSIAQNRAVRRVETQLMTFPYERSRELPGAARLSAFERNFMQVDLNSASLPEADLTRDGWVERWLDQFQDSAAALIAESYRGHVDSLINDQYRDREAARRFLFNIVQYPGCGEFFREGSLVAFDSATSSMAGISLASSVSEQSGHITQLCVAPMARGSKLGYELARRSLAAMAAAGKSRASLTVSAANTKAVGLYHRMGFKTIHRFPAYVWEGL